MTVPERAGRGICPPRALASAVADAALITLFAVVGRASHRESLDVVGVAFTAWPFLVGAAIGWLVLRAWRNPLAIWPTGVGIWLAALVIGMLLRVASGQGVQPAFVIVAAITLALFLVGWRGIAALARRLRRH